MIKTQMISVIFAGILLQIFILAEAVNNSTTQDSLIEIEISEFAITSVNSFIDRINSSRYVFDEYFINNSMEYNQKSTVVNLLSTLGKDTGENIADANTFDDIDDFNGYSTVVYLDDEKTLGLEIKASVSYFDEATNLPTASKKFSKIVTFTVSEAPSNGMFYLKDANGNKLEIKRSVVSSYSNIIK
ncbi:MAG: hypothetical protein GXX85_03195 [Ignavibacteria bacterium]|nr:hypothetical protein [Ignavibacteria bacterium]